MRTTAGLEARPDAPAGARSRIVSTAHGPLRHVLLCYPEHAPAHPRYREAYEALLAALPEGTRFTVLAHPKSSADMETLLRATGRRADVIPAPEDLDFTVWAQDPYVAMRDPDGVASLLRPIAFERSADDGIAEALAASANTRTRRAPVWFHGGNVAVGDRFVLVGGDCVGATLAARAERGERDAPAGVDAETFVASLIERELDPHRKVILVGTKLPVPQRLTRSLQVDGQERLEILHEAAGRIQPLFHIDLFLSLAGRGPSGRYRVLVGSPELADRILGRHAPDQAMNALFDDVASSLAAEGFEVIRNPLPLTYGDGKREIEGAPRRVRVWYFATSNNCLVQIDDEAGNHVWLPTYGHRGWSELAATDDANERIWRDLGFIVHRLPSFHAFAQKSGSLGCITKVLER